MRKAWFLAFSAMFVGLVAACSDADLGESCEEEGKVSGECDEGLVCGKKTNEDGTLVCLKQCSSQAECTATQECNGVGATSLKACREKKQ